MPFVRFSRDKRGYEYVYLFQEPTGKGTASRSRVLYWYRTPPGVKVGREPFDAQVRQALESQNPDVTFDWRSITQAQAPPPPDAEPWRERRRAERSAKQARIAALETPDESVQPEPPAEAVQADSVSAEGLPPASVAPRGRRRRRGGRRRNRGVLAVVSGSAPPEMPAGSQEEVGAEAPAAPEAAGSGNPDTETDDPVQPS